jgi:hypothetical protein
MKPSRVSNTSWIEQTFLRGLSVHDFAPAPFEMDELQAANRTLREELASASPQSPISSPHDYLPPVDEHIGKLRGVRREARGPDDCGDSHARGPVYLEPPVIDPDAIAYGGPPRVYTLEEVAAEHRRSPRFDPSASILAPRPSTGLWPVLVTSLVMWLLIGEAIYRLFIPR